jgi:uncharacterized membrane protein YidH (DUF202 family)
MYENVSRIVRHILILIASAASIYSTPEHNSDNHFDRPRNVLVHIQVVLVVIGSSAT